MTGPFCFCAIVIIRFLAKPVDDASFIDVIGRHLHFDAVADGKTNKALAHFTGNMGEDEVLVRQLNTKHCTRKNRHDDSFQFDCFCRIHDERSGEPAPKAFGAGCAQSIPDLPAIACEWPIGAMGTRPLFAGACLIDVQGSAVKFLAVERSHGGVRLGLVTHGDEGKSARLSSHAVHHQRDFADGAMLFEKILQIVLGSLKGEVSYV